jgi:hypothetical protein
MHASVTSAPSENRNYPITDATEGKWPFVGTAYFNRDGSISVYLDAKATITGGQRLYIRAARDNSQPNGEERAASGAGR